MKNVTITFKPCLKCGSHDYDMFEVSEDALEQEIGEEIIIEPYKCDDCSVINNEDRRVLH